jgi:hypothetical protein
MFVVWRLPTRQTPKQEQKEQGCRLRKQPFAHIPVERTQVRDLEDPSTL